MLAAFSLPWGENPLNLRRERVELEQLLEQLVQTRGAAVELRVIHYGATRETLRSALEDGAGWDLVHLSGHGLEGQLVLEDAAGAADVIDAGKLAELLMPACRHLKLLTLSSCLSAAGGLALARRQIGLDAPRRHAAAVEAAVAPEAAEGAAAEVEVRELPSLAQGLARALDCAVLGMRYRVGDDFAREGVLALYRRLLAKGLTLPEALQLALADTLGAGKPAAPELSWITPVLFGARAADLRLVPPRSSATLSFALRPTGLLHFPSPPERFVGRLRPMLRARRALAPGSARRGVLFHGMAGAGKTACALELAYRHEQDRFAAMVWWKAPDQDREVSGAMLSLAQALETQLPGLELVGLIDDPGDFETRVVPMLRDLLQRVAILVVLDNVESLLTKKGGWRDDRFRALAAGLLEHRGASRLVLTSRRVPADLEAHPALLREAIHALSLPESVVLARELPALRTLFETAGARRVVRQVLAAAQGHPKLLELADGLAGSDRPALEQQLGAEDAEGEPAFFAEGETARGPAAFVAVLESWTAALAGQLPPVARLLFEVLCRMEDEDLESQILEANWKDILERLREGSDAVASSAAVTALEESGHGLGDALGRLAARGLVEVEELPVPGGVAPAAPVAAPAARRFRVHPAVAEAGRRAAPAEVTQAADLELGDFWVSMYRQAYEAEMSGAGRMVVEAGRRAAPYLLRAERWEEAAALLEQVIKRDTSPATVAFALPRLRAVVRATEGTQLGLQTAGLLGLALYRAGQLSESEGLLRELIERCEEEGEFRQASVDFGHLVNLLLTTGRLEEALEVARRKADFTRRAGLGPWTQLLDDVMALQILAAMGRNEEVLERVEGLRERIAELPKERSGEEAVEPWNVHETTLNVGLEAAIRLERWETALSLNAEILRLRVERGADPVELARTRFNDHGPLIRLRQFGAAREILEACRRAYDGVGYTAGLGKVLSALADLEASQQNLREAVRFEEIALRYTYQAGDPEDCAISHNNIAAYLQRSGAAAERVLVHRLADALICFQTGSGGLSTTLQIFLNAGLPGAPPAFVEVADAVEELAGVKFRQLFDRLPRRAADGDAALAEVWKLVAGVEPSAGPDMSQVLRNFASVLQGIAAVARGDDSARAEIESTLPQLEEKGWKLTGAVHRIWDGERDAEALSTGIDANSARLVERVLELIELPSPEEVLAGAPAAVRAALEAGDAEALQGALGEMPAEEAEALVERLRALGVLG